MDTLKYLFYVCLIIAPTIQDVESLKLTVSQRTLLIPRGGRGVLECTPEGYPLPKVQWKKADGEFRTGVTPNGNTLIITDARPEDRGHYVCQGIIEGTVVLTNYSAVEIGNPPSPGNIKVTVSAPELVIPRGGSGTIQCTPEGYPLPRVQWLKSDGQFSSRVTKSGHALIITDAQDEDRGHYVCQGIVDATVVSTSYTKVDLEEPSAPGPLKLTVSHKQLVIPRGGNGTIECTAEGYPLPRLQWKKADGDFRNGLTPNGGKLIITDARDEDRANYVCEAIVEGTVVLTAYSQIDIGANLLPVTPSAPYVVVSNEQVKIVKGQSVSVTCTPGGYPLPHVRWLKHDGSFGAGTRQNENTLTITNAQESDAGYYVCYGVVGTEEVDSKYVSVEIEEPSAPGPLKLTVSHKQLVIPRGGNGTIECTAEGYPLPRLQWKKADGDFRNGVIPNGGTLIITDARDEDRANYVCEAIVEGTVVLTAYSQIDIGANLLPVTPSAPYVVVSNEQVKIVKGQSASVTCTPGGYPLPHVRWVKHDGSFGAGTSQKGNTLTITNAQESDAGYYVCYGVVGTEEVDSKYVSVEIEEPSAPGPLKLTVSHKQLVIPRGGNGTIECTAEGYPLPRLQWKKADGDFRNGVIPNGGTLIITDARDEDRANYVCEAIVEGTVVLTAYSQIDIGANLIPVTPSAPYVVVSNEKVKIVKGQSASVTCTPGGYPLPHVRWAKHDGSFGAGTSQKGNTLTITNAQESDAGYYVCYGVVGTEEVDSKYVSVEIEEPSAPGPLKLTVSHKQLVIPRGGNGTIECTAEGYPLPRLQWKKADGDFRNGVTPNGGTLIITDARDEDRANYVCEAIVEGTVVLTAYSQIDIGDKQSPENPKIEVSEDQLKISEGQSVSVTCTPEGNPLPRIQWIKHDGDIGARTSQNGNTLKITNAQKTDGGYYACVGIVGTEEIDRKYVAVDIESQRSPPGSPRVSVSERQIKIPRGESLNIDCTPTGNPLPTVQWIKSDGAFRTAGVTKSGNTLIISDAREEDRGIYVCNGVVDGTVMTTDYASVDIESISTASNPSPAQLSTPIDVVISEGDRTRIGCNFETGDYEQKITWTRRDQRPLPINAQQVGSDLVISSASQEDAGEYLCEVTASRRRLRLRKAYIKLQVLSVPRVTVRPAVQTVTRGQAVTVECLVEDGSAQVTWDRLDKPLSRLVTQGSTLTFSRIELADAGFYRCSARSRAGVAQIIVKDVPSGSRLRVSQRELTIPRGQNATIECIPDGNPLPRVNWIKSDGAFRHGVIPSGNTLIIADARDEDRGDYVCQGIVEGTVTGTDYTRVDIGNPPSPGNYKLTVSEQQLLIPRGGRATIECIPEGYPLPRVNWKKADGDFRNGVTQSGNTLIITDAREEDRANYVCEGTVEGTVVLTNYSQIDIGDATPPERMVQGPRVTVSERQLSIPRGGQGSIVCTPEGYPLPTVQWKKADGEFRTGVTHGGNTLVITDARQEDRGHYVCQGVVDGTVVITSYSTVDIRDPPSPGNFKLTVSEQQLLIPKGGRATIECIPEGYPLPRVNWKKADGDFRNGVTQSGNTLIITDARDEDRANYVCEGTVEGTVVLTNYSQIDIGDATPPEQMVQGPRVTVSERQLSIPRGGQGSIVCTPEGYPLPTVEWKKADGEFRTGVTHGGNTLVITDARQEDRGHYVCQGVVDGTVVITSYSTVDIRDYEIEEQPVSGNYRVQVNARTLKIPRGGNQTVECIPEGFPLPTIKWTKHGGEFGAGTRQIGNVLLISNVQEQDEGYYVCDGVVDDSTVWTDYLAVEIEDEANSKSQTFSGYPRVTARIRELSLPTGGTASVDCTAEGSPLPSVLWTKDPGDFGVGTRQSGSSLVISDAQESDRGVYACSAVVNGDVVFSDYLSVDVQNICALPEDTGPCRAEMPRWFYDNTQHQCRQFYYGGCQGNKNNFETREQCSLQCEVIRR